MSQVLPDSYTFQREKLIEPIRKASILRSMGIPITASAKVFENTTIITTVTDDPKIAISPEPVAGVRSSNQVSQVRKDIPTISAPTSYKYDELLRIDNGILPADRRLAILAGWLADAEEAHAFALSTSGVRDSDAIPFIQGGTAVSTFSLVDGDAALTALAANIGVFIARYGTLKTRPLVLCFNAVSYARAMGLTSSKTDKTFFQSALEMLLLHGGAGSGIVLLNHLGNVMTQEDDVISIADSTDETMALFLMDINHFEIITSELDQRSDGVSQLTGLIINIVERFFPYVHDALSIHYQINVAIT